MICEGMNTEQVLFALIRNVICGEAVTEQVKNACTPELLEEVYALAHKHDLSHLAGQALSKLSLPECDGLKRMKTAVMQAVARYVKLEHAYQCVCGVLEEAQIFFIPLKGAVLRQYYPEPWMRTSCDTDILVRPEDLDRAAAVLEEKLHYRRTGHTPHDITFQCPGGTHLELHFDLVEDHRANDACKILSDVWEHVMPAQGKQYQLEMTDTFFYFYHIAHMAKHFESGGCGVRPFLDLWILENKKAYHDDLDALLEKSNLMAFASASRKLSQMWLSGVEADADSRQFAHFILTGGVYGSLENGVRLQGKKTGGKWGYAMKRIFMPYDQLKHFYPILKKHRWMTPLFQLVRWCRVIFTGNMQKAATELQANAALSDGDSCAAHDLMNYLGLD